MQDKGPTKEGKHIGEQGKKNIVDVMHLGDGIATRKLDEFNGYSYFLILFVRITQQSVIDIRFHAKGRLCFFKVF